MTPPTPAPPVEWYAALRAVLRELRRDWKVTSLLVLTGGGVAAGVVLVLPSYYRAGAAFQAETPAPPQLGGALAGLASQVTGLQIGGQNTAQLYGDLLSSDAVVYRLVACPLPWGGRTEPLTAIYDLASGDTLLSEYRAAQKLRSAMNVDVNIRTGVVRFSVDARTPALALALAESTLAVLNDANIALRQTRASAERTFTASRAEQARADLAAAESTLAVFYERNRAVSGSPMLQLEESRLRRMVDMAQQVYVQLRLQDEQAAAQSVRNTPALSVIDPPRLPARRARPNRRAGVLIGLLLGALAAGFRLLLATPNAESSE